MNATTASVTWIGLAACSSLALAQPAPQRSNIAAPTARASPTPGPSNEPAPGPSSLTGIWDRPALLGDPGGIRSDLANHGISLGLLETSEVLGNPTGGVRQGAIYEGLTEASLGLDLGKLVGLDNAVINVSAFQIHGRGLSENDIGNLNYVSNIEATRSTKLFELFYQQGFLGGKIDIRLGQLAADQEFLASQYSSALINSTSFGWPNLPSQDVPDSGPIYPLAALGVRARWFISNRTTMMAGVYNGSPAGPGAGDPQRRDGSGTSFRLNDGVFAITELQYVLNGGAGPQGLPGTYKLGAWYEQRGTFDQRFDTMGRSLASPSTNGQPHQRNGDYSLYVTLDQLLYREPRTTDEGAAVFFRIMGAPEDRNLVSFFVDAGVTYKGLIPGRDGDTIALGTSLSRISPDAGHLDADTHVYSGGFVPIRSSEEILELTYQCQATPWLLAQPDLQYVFNPSGGVADPARAGRRIGDALMVGLRMVVTL